MKTRIQLALMGCLLSVFAHLYLVLHYYPLKFGFATGNSICSLNAKFDCDAVSASAYSALFGVPLAAWGMALNAVLFLLIIFSWLEWSDHPERLKRWTIVLAALSAIGSVIMASISLSLMTAYCLFCITLYIFSFLILWAVLGWKRGPFWADLKDDLPRLWTESRGVLIAFAAVPFFAVMTDQIFAQNLGGAQVARVVDEAVSEWSNAPTMNFVAKPTLTAGPAGEKATLSLVEFADFRCGHCRHASYTLHAFVKAHPDVRFEFYSFPLDGACNEKISQSSGVSCRLAASVYCAEKESKGWAMHDVLYDKQDEVNDLSSPAELDNWLARESTALGLNWESLNRCIAQGETIEAIKAQAKQGALVNVMGTPTLFANGRNINHGHMVPVLQAIYDNARANPKTRKE